MKTSFFNLAFVMHCDPDGTLCIHYVSVLSMTYCSRNEKKKMMGVTLLFKFSSKIVLDGIGDLIATVSAS